MKNLLPSIKIVFKEFKLDFFTMIFSLLLKVCGPIVFTFSVIRLIANIESALKGGFFDIKSVFYFAVAILFMNFHSIFYSRFYSTFYSMPRIELKLKEKIHEKIANISSNYLVNAVSDIEVNRAVFAGTNIFRLVEAFFELVFTFVSGISIITLIANINFEIALFFLAAVVPILIYKRYIISIKFKNRYKKIDINRLNKLNHEAIIGFPQFIESRVNNSDNFFENKYKNLSTKYNNLIKGESKSKLKFSSILLIPLIYSDASSLALNSLFLYYNKISFSEFGGIIAAYNSLKRELENVFNLITYNRQFNTMVQPFFDLINLNERDGSKEKVNNLIEFKNVYYKYPNSKTDVIININIKIKKGEKIALVGENGSGKTTFVRLLTGELIPSKGDVFYQNISTREISDKNMYSNTSQVNQFFNRYYLTLKENIAFNNKLNFNQNEVNKFLKSNSLNLEDYISKEFGGIEFSGGQWQRIAILRGFNKKSDLVVLDEPTSAIDPINESEIYKFFHENSIFKTSIIVTHRLGAIKNVDRIIVMSQGKIVEDGNFDSLMKTDSEFKRIYKSQMDLFL